jgi:hypothetical protein
MRGQATNGARTVRFCSVLALTVPTVLVSPGARAEQEDRPSVLPAWIYACCVYRKIATRLRRDGAESPGFAGGAPDGHNTARAT